MLDKFKNQSGTMHGEIIKQLKFKPISEYVADNCNRITALEEQDIMDHIKSLRTRVSALEDQTSGCELTLEGYL